MVIVTCIFDWLMYIYCDYENCMHERECLFMDVRSFHPRRWCFISNWVWYGLELRWSVSSVFGIVKFRLGTNDYKRQPAFHFYWRPHFIFKWFFFSSLTFTWYRLLQLVSIRHLCSMHNFEYAKKEKDGTRRSANFKKSNLLDVCIFMQFMLCCYIAISSFYFFSNFQSQSTILD